MRFKIDHDYHIHSYLSSCSRDKNQSPENILNYAISSGLKQICVTDHYWDSEIGGASNWYAEQNYEHISSILPLPQSDNVEFLFGAECEMDKNFNLSIPSSRFDDFSFIIVPTTHLQMKGLTISEEDFSNPSAIARLWVERLDALLDKDLPFKKIGIAHSVCGLMIKNSREELLNAISLIPTTEMERLFNKASKLGVGIELNLSDMSFSDEEQDIILRPFKIAKQRGCKFYLGSDAHHLKDFNNSQQIFNRAIDLLDLKESDKFKL